MPLFLNVPQDHANIHFYFPSVQEQTGWSRSNPLHLLTDYDILLKITSYCYDLLNKDFVNYAIKRGCMNGAGCPSPIDPDFTEDSSILAKEALQEINHSQYVIRRYVRCHWLGKSDFMAAREKIFTAAVAGKKPKAIVGEEKESLWECIPPARARIQDCWEVYLINFCNTGNIQMENKL